MSDLSDHIEVNVLSIDGLGLVDGSLPTTFAEVVVGSDKKRTRVVTDSRNPRFDSDPLIFTDLISQSIDAIMVYVKHLSYSGTEIPLGVVVIPMDTPFNSPKMELDSVYDLEPTTGVPLDTAGKFGVRGKIRIKMIYFNVIDPELIVDVHSSDMHVPNMLSVKVIDGKSIGLARGYKSGVDAIVQVEVGELRETTRIAKRNTNPEWNTELSLPVDDGSQLVDIWVKHCSLVRNLFLGRSRITLNEVAEAGDGGLLKTFMLYNEALQYDDHLFYGTIQLHLTWEFNDDVHKQKVAGKKKGMFRALKDVVFGKKAKDKAAGSAPAQADTDAMMDADANALEAARVSAAAGKKRVTDQFDLASMSPFELSTFLDDQRRERDAEIAELLTVQQDDVPMPEGDYNIMIHLLELNDLRVDPSGRPPNPMVYIECFGKKFHSKALYSTTSDFFDEVFYFSMPGLRRDQIAESFVRITVVDHFKLDILKRGWFESTVGVYAIDLATIYNNKDHELHRKWGTLRDPHNELDSGPQGLVKYSAVCLGPGDVQKMHDPQKEEDGDENADLDELEEDLQKTEGAGVVDVGAASRFPSGDGNGTSQSLQFLVIGVLKAEGLPGFDRIFTSQGLYAYVQCEFAGCKPIKTTKVRCLGKENLSITFEEELWIPVWVPTLCKRVAISIKNSELGRSDQIVATSYVDFQMIRKYAEDPIKSGSSWFSSTGTYDGPPLQLLHFYGANPSVRAGPKAARFMNKFPNHASSYRGSLSCSLRIVKHSRVTEAAHKMVMGYEIPDTLMPEFTSYNLKVMVFQGSDFGSKGAHAGKGSGVLYSTDYCMSITVGDQEMRTSFKTYADGSVDWLELCEKSNIVLPKNLSFMPDAFITIYKGSPSSHTSIAFLRLKTVELLATGIKSVPRWYDLRHDESHSQTSTAGFPGSILLRLSLVNMQDAALTGDWEEERKKMRVKQAYCLRALIYQCRSLPGVRDNALIDPYIKVRFCGSKEKTKTVRNTQNPIYFETLEFHKELPTDLRLSPNLLLQVWDNKILRKFPVGAMRVPITSIPISKNPNYQDNVDPTWQKLKGIDGKGDMGEVLVRFILIEKKNKEQNIQPARAIEPNLRKCFLDIHAIGLRGLISPGITNIRMPYLYFDLFSSGYGDSAKGEPSRIPSATDPNFLDRHIIQTYIPDDPLYCPVLEIHVYDQRYTDKTLLGVISVDLRSKLPWNGDQFVPPRQHFIMSEAAKAKELLAKEKTRLAKQAKANKDMARMQNKAMLLGKPVASPVGHDDNPDDEDSTEVLNALRDDGGGVFPLEAGATEMGSQYSSLPPIIDGDEDDDAFKKRARQYEKEKDADGNLIAGTVSDGSALGDAKAEEALLKKLIGFPTAWTAHDFLSGRDWWMKSKKSGEGGQLEDYLQTYAFENYDLIQGHVAFNKFRRRRNTQRKVGYLKAVICVTMKNPRTDEEFTKFAKAYRNTEKVLVRLYVVKAQHLLPTDIFGSSTSKQKADPYLKVKLGDIEVKDVGNVQKRNLNPDFFSCYEFPTTIAGPTKLQLGIWDKNLFSSDTLMGETTIDIEDRWFHPKWSALTMKPAEVRTLYKSGGGSTAAGNTTSQGLVTLWVDVFTQADAVLEENAKVEISGPARQKFQLRIVTWRSQDVPNVDGGASDLFMRYSMQGATQNYMTDTHWRCKDGNGSWNYRSLIPLELPIKKREEGRLKMEMMERNIVTANTLIGIHVFNLYDWLMLAYKRQTTIFPLKERKEKMKQREKMLAAKADTGLNNDPNVIGNGDEDWDESDESEDGDPLDGENSGLDDDMGSDNDFDGNDDQPLLGKNKDYGTSVQVKKGKTKKSEEEADIELVPLPAAEGDQESNIGAIFNQINVYLGVGDSVADDADWFNIEFNSRESTSAEYLGRIAVSMSIVPEVEYENDPVGSGRNEPNKDPYLPPPNGRLSFSLNPMAIFYELCSPRVICAIICCLCCMVLVVLMMLVGTQLSGWMALIQLMKGGKK